MQFLVVLDAQFWFCDAYMRFLRLFWAHTCGIGWARGGYMLVFPFCASFAYVCVSFGLFGAYMHFIPRISGIYAGFTALGMDICVFPGSFLAYIRRFSIFAVYLSTVFGAYM
jgi:hypothetical protein